MNITTRECRGKGKRKDNGEWVEGSLISFDKKRMAILKSKTTAYRPENSTVLCSNSCFDIISETFGEYTELLDKNNKKVFEGDIVKLLGFQTGYIAKQHGAFGIVITPSIDWDYLDSKIIEITGCNNDSYFCKNDNFVSLWELMWNYNQEENRCEVIEIIGNIHDNPRLLKSRKRIESRCKEQN